MPKVSALKAHADVTTAIGDPGDPVDHPASAAASEDHGVGSQQDLHPLYVVEVTMILDVVPYPIDEEVRGRGVATKVRGVTMTLPLADGGPRDKAQDIRHGLHGLVADQLGRDHADGLWDVAKVSCNPQGGVEAFGQVTVIHMGGDDER